jgi:predicted branched-subunit amino acid permease
MKWIELSIKIKETFQNLSAKARALAAMGRKDEAYTVADQAIQRGKSDKNDTTRFEKWLADSKAGKL